VPGVVFQDAWQVAGDGSPGHTWSRRNPEAARERFGDARLDYILIQWAGRGAVLGAEVIDGRLPGGTWGSDHLAVLAELDLDALDQAIWKQLDSRRGDARLGIPATDTGTVTVIDYSQPNIAKEMHVGRLRSTVIGDALVRILEFDAAKVIRHNHIGDWGTQFGMLIEFMQEEPEGRLAVGQGESGEEAISRLDALYRASRKKFDSDEEFADRAPQAQPPIGYRTLA
jgi:arginyl-tRNA synthetase